MLKQKIDKTAKIKIVPNEYRFHLYERFGIIFSSFNNKATSHLSMELFARV